MTVAALTSNLPSLQYRRARRNRGWFPEGFMFELTPEEKQGLVAKCDWLATLRHSSSQPYAFTEHGAHSAQG